MSMRLHGGKKLAMVSVGVLAASGIVGGVFLLVESVADANARVSSTENVKAESSLTVQERKDMSRAAGHMLRHIYNARIAVSKKDKGRALGQVKQALRLSQIIKQVMPKYDVDTKIRAGKLVYEDKETAQPLLVPLFEELDRVQMLEPMHAAKREAHTSVKGKAGNDVVAEADDQYLSAEMDVKWATTQLWTAKYYLERGNWEKADNNLWLAQRSVNLEADVVLTPLAKAADNIALAQQMIQAGHTKHAAAALRTASRTLTRYSHYMGRVRQKEVTRLQAQIGTLQKRLSSGKALSSEERTSATNKTKGWWNRLLPWRAKDVCVASSADKKGSGSQQCIAR